MCVQCCNDLCRCNKEWQYAINLSHYKVSVVVGAVSSCNRPEPLKHFLYLDFMDREKRRIVWDKLSQAIGKTYILIYTINGCM